VVARPPAGPSALLAGGGKPTFHGPRARLTGGGKHTQDWQGSTLAGRGRPDKAGCDRFPRNWR